MNPFNVIKIMCLERNGTDTFTSTFEKYIQIATIFVKTVKSKKQRYVAALSFPDYMDSRVQRHLVHLLVPLVFLSLFYRQDVHLQPSYAGQRRF